MKVWRREPEGEEKGPVLLVVWTRSASRTRLCRAEVGENRSKGRKQPLASAPRRPAPAPPNSQGSSNFFHPQLERRRFPPCGSLAKGAPRRQNF